MTTPFLEALKIIEILLNSTSADEKYEIAKQFLEEQKRKLESVS